MKYLVFLLLVGCAVPNLKMSPDLQYQRATLVKKPQRSQYGYKLTLVNDSNVTIVRYVQYRNPYWVVGGCYMVIK